MRFFIMSLLIVTGFAAQAQNNTVEDKIDAAMASDNRTAAEMGRDRNRKSRRLKLSAEFWGVKVLVTSTTSGISEAHAVEKS